MRRTHLFLIAFGALCVKSATAVDFTYNVEGLTTGGLIYGQDGWTAQSGIASQNIRVVASEHSPRNGSTQCLQVQSGSGIDRAWRNMNKNSTGVYLFGWDVKFNGGYNSNNTLDGDFYRMRIATKDNGGASTDGIITQPGLLINPTDGDNNFFSGPYPSLSDFTNGFGIVFFPGLTVQSSHWYRFEYILDLDQGITRGPIVTDIEGGAFNNVASLTLANHIGQNNTDSLGAFYKDAESFCLGSDGTAVTSPAITWFDNFAFQRMGQISGTIQLQNYDGVNADISDWVGSIVLRSTGNPDRVYSVNLALDGSYTAYALPGTYTLHAKVGHWLSSARSGSLIVTAGGAISAGALSLRNGDIDRDDAVTVFDYGILSDYFDHSDADSDWNTVGSNGFAPSSADLDADGVVSVFDYGILSSNFDQVGSLSS